MADEKDKKNSVKVGVMNEPKSLNPGGPEILAAAKAMPKLGPQPDVVKPGWVISSNDYPQDVIYGKELLHFSARSKQYVHDVGLLQSPLPHGIHLKV